jgi:hypothetical protein
MIDNVSTFPINNDNDEIGPNNINNNNELGANEIDTLPTNIVAGLFGCLGKMIFVNRWIINCLTCTFITLEYMCNDDNLHQK